MLRALVVALPSQGLRHQVGMTCIEPPSQTVFHDLPGEQLHRAADRSMFNQSSVVEVADKLLHRKLPPQPLDPLDTVVGITEDPNFTINALESRLGEPVPQLFVLLVALDRGTR